MKRFFCALLCLSVLLTGCAAIPTAEEVSDYLLIDAGHGGFDGGGLGELFHFFMGDPLPAGVGKGGSCIDVIQAHIPDQVRKYVPRFSKKLDLRGMNSGKVG